MAQENIAIVLQGIGSLLSEGQLKVPRYQRSYAWLDDEVASFFEDIDRAIDDGEAEYFLGSAVLSNQGSHREIIDGQQRLTTASIAIAVISAWLSNTDVVEDQKRGELIRSKYLYETDLDSLEILPKLELSIYDHAFYRGHILDRDDGAVPDRDSHRRLAATRKFTMKWISEVVDRKKDEAPKYLRDWLSFLEKCAKVIAVTVHDNANAFRIFETLNARGRDLTVFDLVKNYLFCESGNKIDLAEKYWIEIQANLDSIEGQNKHADFVRHSWAAQNGLTREKELYGSVQSKVGNATQAIKAIESLKLSSQKYGDIVNCTATAWDGYNESFNENLKVIRVLKVEMVRPLILAMAVHLRPPLAMRCMDFVVSCLVRSSVAATNRRYLEDAYAEMAKDISSESLRTKNAIRDRLKVISPNNTEFEAAFRSITIKSAPIARLYLSKIEGEASSSGTLVPSQDPSEVNLEHVLPKIAGADWPNFDAETHKAYRNRLGNYSLLASLENSKLGNQPFIEKAKVLKTSAFITTRKIADYAEWSVESINNHQAYLASLAVKVWDFQG